MYVNSIRLYANSINMSFKFTKNQASILDVFFRRPGEELYLSQIGRMLDKKPGVFQRDINDLVVDGILHSHRRANNRFFQLNKNYPLYNELKSIVFKTTGIVGTLRDELKKIKGVHQAFIHGSFAKGTEHRASDIDLMVIGAVDEDEFLDVVSKLEGQFGRPINYGLMSEEEFHKKIKNQDSFLLNVVKGKKIELL